MNSANIAIIFDLCKKCNYLCGCGWLYGTYLVVLGALCLTLRLLQWGKFFSLDESIIVFFLLSFLVPNVSNN